MSDLEEVIASSIEDSTPDATTEVQEATHTPDLEVAPEPTETPTEPTLEVTPLDPEADTFSMEYGVQAQTVLGRENRIPYHRVKKITETAVSKLAETALGRPLGKDEKPHEVVKAYVARLPELETKVKGYEEQLGRVDKFEKIMVNQPDQFLEMLSGIPAYRDFFTAIEQALATAQAPAKTSTQVPSPDDQMPVPNEALPDGSRVYNEEGLSNLLEWQARKIEARVTKQIEERYKPIETAWQADQRIQSLVPQVKSQIAEARTWDMFTENEPAIVDVLKSNPKISLEGAYRQVVTTKYNEKIQALSTDRNKIREEILKEVQQAPRATTVSSTQTKAVPAPTGPRSLEDIIAEEVKKIK